MVWYVVIVGISVLADQLVKWWTVQNIELYETIFNNPILSLTYIKNEGAAWSILEGKMGFFFSSKNKI